MDEHRISAAIMCHPRRRAAAERLARAVVGLAPTIAEDPEPDGPPSALRASLRAWAAIRPEATHHLVLQDDVLVAGGFAERVAASVALHPDAALAFCAFWHSWNGSAIRIAAVAGASWARAVAEEFAPTLALVLPRGDVAGLLQAAAATGPGTADDVLVSDYLRGARRPLLVSVPNLVEHDEGVSMVGNDHQGQRRVTCFAGAGDGDARVLDPSRSSSVLPPQRVLPQLAGERANVLLWDPSPGRERWRWLPWLAYLRQVGLWPAVAEEVAALPTGKLGDLSPDRAAFAREVWGAGLLLGLLAGPDPRGHPAVVGECLRTLVLGGVTHSSLRDWAVERVGPIAALAETALRRGTGLARLGRVREVDRQVLAGLPDGRQVWDFMGGPAARGGGRAWWRVPLRGHPRDWP